jgi:hypothetical protein
MREEINTTLRDAFEHAATWLLERQEIPGETLTKADSNDADLYLKLAKSVDGIPPELTGELAAMPPATFQRSLEFLILRVGGKFQPASATEFVEALIKHVRASHL